MRNPNRRSAIQAGLLGALALSGTLLLPTAALAGEVIYSTFPYEHHGVVISAQKVFLKKDKLWFRLTVINSTGRLLTIDKNQLRLVLPDGTELARAEGVFGKYAKPHLINPGLSHALDIEFVIGEVPRPVALVLRQGFIVDGHSMPLPDFAVSPVGVK